MAETTNIGWVDMTGSPHFGCTQVSPGCSHCYAMELALAKFAPMIREAYRKAGFKDWTTMPVWGDKAPRVIAKGFWKNVASWNRKAERALKEWSETPGAPPMPKRLTIFPSMIDWLDEFKAGIIDQDGTKWDANAFRQRILNTIRETPYLDWLLLTKRIENFKQCLTDCLKYNEDNHGPAELHKWMLDWLTGDETPLNVWGGVTVEDKARKVRLEKLRNTPFRVRFVSFEPLLEDLALTAADLKGIDWGIVGGESGKDYRDCGVDAIVSTATAIHENGVALYMKQDAAYKSGEKGRIPDYWWAVKNFPKT